MSIYKFNPDDAERFGLEQHIKRQTRGDELVFERCPYCGETTEDKRTFAINLKTGQFNCFRASCKAHGNMITLAKDFGFSLGRDVDEYLNSRKRYRDLRKYPTPETRPAAVEYMETRGISRNITERYHLTTNKDDSHVLVFPFYDENNQLQFVKYRKTDFQKGIDKNKEWCEPNCKPILFGMDQCNAEESKVLVLTEGQIDSLSVAEAFDGEVNAVSVPTGANGFTWVPYCWDFLGRFNTLIVFGDYENDHVTLLEEMQTRFNGTVKHVRPEDYRDCKDANDLLRKYGKQAVVYAVENAEAVQNPHIKKLSEVERKSIADMDSIDTGIVQLNQILGGFYYGQLIILTGERGLGKSTLGSQFVTHAINQRVPVFCYSGELPDWMFQDWFDRQCAGPEYINRMDSPRGAPNYLVNGAYIGAIHEWYDDYCYIYDNSIIGDEENETILETIMTAVMQYGCKFIMIDNLMTAICDDMKSDLYRQQTAFVRELKQIAYQCNVTILLVAHPRKRNGQNFGNEDVAGSSNITNLADTVLNYATPKDPEGNPRPDRILQVTKNRLMGTLSFNGIPLWYDNASKRISELKGGCDWQFDWDNREPEDGTEFMDINNMEIPF